MTYFRRFALVFNSMFTIGALVASAGDGQSPVSEQTRHDLLEARETAWRAFFSPQPDTAIEQALGPDLIAIQESEEKWENRSHLIAIAKDLKAKGVQLLRLEFPRTEIQVFGNTAILYYTYVFETGIKGKSTGVDAGRGTEIFTSRDGHWIDVGWHLDNGPFYQKDGHWVKNGSHPEPHDVPPPG